jgi:hypothetical protein
MSTRASDELYLIIKTYCKMVELFYLPVVPDQKIIIELHEDTFKLCQDVLFSDGLILRTV